MKIKPVGNGMRAQRGIVLLILTLLVCAGGAGGLWYWTSTQMGGGPAGVANSDMGSVGMVTNNPPDEWYRTNGIPNPR